MSNYTILSKKFKLLFPLILLSTVFLSAQDAFILSWKTDNPGGSNSTSITIPVAPSQEYLYDVDWNNDGIYDEFQITESINHDFGIAGTYTIRIKGIFPQISFKNGDDQEKLIDISQWGAIEWRSMNGAFQGCSNLNISATDAPDLSNVKDFTSAFKGCTNFNSPIGHWDVSNVESFYFTFSNCQAFNQPLNEWNTSSVRTMQRMFINCPSFNQALNNWEVGSVSSFSAMFNNCTAFNQDLSNWDMSSAVHLALMFAGASSFNQDIGGWQLDHVTNIHTMFKNAVSFNQDIGNWNVSKVSSIANLFQNAQAFNQDISSWDVSQVQNMDWTFANAISFDQDLSNWNTGNVTRMQYTFYRALVFNQDISNWDVSQVTRMAHMLDQAALFNQDIGEWDVSQVYQFGSMFLKALSFDQDLSNWDVSQATKMSNMFHDVTLSTENYDQILTAWSALDLQDSVIFDAGNSIYCEGWTGREVMIAEKSWTVQDGGSDTTPPVATCKDITVQLDQSTKTITPDMLNDNSSGKCSEVYLTASKTTFDCDDIGSLIDTLWVIDALGNESTCLANVLVSDGPISFNCPEDISIKANSAGCQAIVYWEALYGNCDTNVSSSHASGDTFPLGTTTVTYKAVDAFANTTECSFTVTVYTDLSIDIDAVQDPSCHGFSDGKISLTTTGGAPSYSYDWGIDGTGDFDDEEDLQDLGAGSYRLFIKDVYACKASLLIDLLEPDLLSVSSVISENMNTQQSTIDLSVSGGTPGYQYDWDIDGTGDFDDPEDIEITSSGTYTVNIKDQNNCTTNHQVETIINSIHAAHLLMYFELSPNPSKGLLNLKLSNYNRSSNIDIFDTQGKNVYSQSIIGQEATLTLDELPKGTYLLRLSNELGTLVKPFVVAEDGR